ncbi:unnamed protein product [Cuscuta campestris]|uniref:Calmodulin-binding domain-containing protein n=1 Tax=Cuscuta campestris TaxID=132261 RepID=A0A484KT96_9ASTE|nr:unnamed protein product [Cuscuta campestris]
MAEDNINSSLDLETLAKESEGGCPIKSSKIEALVLPSDGIGSRRYSTGKQNSHPGSDQTTNPHYLRASTGSCHDFCKYGRNHSSEQKPVLPLPRRRKKPLNQKPIPARASGTSVSGARDSEEAHFQTPAEIIKDVVFLQPKEVESSPVQDFSKLERKIKNMSSKGHSPKPLTRPSLSKSLDSLKPSSRKSWERDANTKPGRKKVMEPLTDSSTSKSSVSEATKLREQVSKGVEPLTASSTSKSSVSEATKPRKRVSKVVEPLTASSTSKSSVSEAIKPRKRLSLTSTPMKNQNQTGEADCGAKEGVSEKTLHVIQMEDVEPTQDGGIIGSLSSPESLLLPESSSVSHTPDSIIESKPSKTMTKSKQPVLPKPDIPSPVKLKFRREDGNKEGKDKTLESVDDRSTSSPLPPSSGKEDEKNISADSKGVKSGGRSQIKTSKRGNLIVARVETPLPVKLKFRRGTVVNLHQENNSGPRRLNFRKGRTVRKNPEDKDTVDGKEGGEQDAKEAGPELATSKGGDDKKIGSNSNGANLHNENKRFSFAKGGRDLREIQGSKSSDSVKRRNSKKRTEGGENSKEAMEPRKVVLRHHQDVQEGKKDGQGLLLNNVIEETASKLVESKKSKVKALVGAFETVISLQEKKPSASSAS